MDGTVQPSGVNTLAGWSGTIWQDCPVEAIRDGQTPGFLYEKTFNTLPIFAAGAEGSAGANFGDSGAGYLSTTATITPDITEVGGGAAFAATADNEGAGFRTVEVPVKLILTGGDFWAEWRMLTSTITDTKHDIFAGLMSNNALTAISPITAAGVLADVGLVGFFRPETARTVAGTGGAIMNAVYKASGVAAVTVQTDAVALVANTYTNLGLKFVPKRNIGNGPGYLKWYQDGVQVAQKLIPTALGTDFPNNVNLGFVFAILDAAAAQTDKSVIKKVRIAQLLKAYP